MKSLKLLFVALLLAVVNTSCFLFRSSGGHERCPAYGQQLEEEERMEEVAVETIKVGQELN